MFLEKSNLPETPIRLALHWGAVKSDPGGGPLGAEAHRVFKIEGVKEDDCLEPSDRKIALPAHGRILATWQALEQLNDIERSIRSLIKFLQAPSTEPLPIGKPFSRYSS